MPSYDYEYYICPKCKTRLTTKTCPTCQVKTKGQGKVSGRYRLIDNDGKKKNKRTGWYDTKREAEAEYLKVKTFAPKVDYRARENTSYLYEDLLQEFLTENALETAESTQYVKKGDFDKHITPYFKGKDIRKIDKPMLIDWQVKLFSKQVGGKKKRTISYTYAERIRVFLNTFFEWVFYKYEISNPLRAIKKPRRNQPKKSKEFLELPEFPPLDEASKDDILWNTIFCLFMHSGNRIGEIQAFSESDYQYGGLTTSKTISKDDNGRSRVSPMPKNKKEYTKPLDDFIIQRLDKYIAWKRENGISDKFLFGGDNFMDKYYYESKLKYYIERAGIKKHISPHSFRYSYVSMLVDMDCTTKTVAEMIGDTEEVVMKTYSFLYTTKKVRTVDKLNNYLTQNLGTNAGTKATNDRLSQPKVEGN